MGNESGTWIMHGIKANNPGCIHTVEELEDYIDKVGFLPLFQNGIRGFSVEEHVESGYWWSGNKEKDPWEWREIIARDGRIAYGKFFDRKAGFISRAWFPAFANHRRDGYDFDARWIDEKASFREKQIMDCFMMPDGDGVDTAATWFSNALKEKAGFGKDGAKNFEGIVTDLQMKTYLCVKEFRQRTNKSGGLYGWPIAVYTVPEALWGYDTVAAGYRETPEESRARIYRKMRELYPEVTEKQLKSI